MNWQQILSITMTVLFFIGVALFVAIKYRKIDRNYEDSTRLQYLAIYIGFPMLTSSMAISIALMITSNSDIGIDGVTVRGAVTISAVIILTLLILHGLIAKLLKIKNVKWKMFPLYFPISTIVFMYFSTTTWSTDQEVFLTGLLIAHVIYWLLVDLTNLLGEDYASKQSVKEDVKDIIANSAKKVHGHTKRVVSKTTRKAKGKKND